MNCALLTGPGDRLEASSQDLVNEPEYKQSNEHDRKNRPLVRLDDPGAFDILAGERNQLGLELPKELVEAGRCGIQISRNGGRLVARGRWIGDG